MQLNQLMDMYSTERIIDVKGVGKSKKFLIKWEGYDNDENTWEPGTHALCSTPLCSTPPAGLIRRTPWYPRARALRSRAPLEKAYR